MEKVTYQEYALNEKQNWVKDGRKPATLLKWFPLDGGLFGLMEYKGIPIVRSHTEIEFDYIKYGDKVVLTQNFTMKNKLDIDTEGIVKGVVRDESGNVIDVYVLFDDKKIKVDIREIEKI